MLKDAMLELKSGDPLFCVFARPGGIKFSPVHRCIRTTSLKQGDLLTFVSIIHPKPKINIHLPFNRRLT